MSWLARLFQKSAPVVPAAAEPAPAWRPVTTTPWADLGATTAEPMAIRKPINIQRTMLDVPRHLAAGDTMQVHITRTEEGRLVWRETTPVFPVNRTMVVDSVTKFEVIDELGVDVGIGFVLGQAKA